jgi:hypothetical protein
MNHFTPMPLIKITEGIPPDELGMLIVPRLWPGATGVKVAVISHVAPTAKGDEEVQLSVSE